MGHRITLNQLWGGSGAEDLEEGDDFDKGTKSRAQTMGHQPPPWGFPVILENLDPGQALSLSTAASIRIEQQKKVRTGSKNKSKQNAYA